MKEFEKKVLENLKNLYPSKESPSNSYTAIAFDWFSSLGEPYMLHLIYYIVKVTPDGISEEKVDTCNIEFDEFDISPKVKGSSQTVGLIPKTSFYYDEKKAAVFERNLADIIINILYKIFKNNEKCVILQGPLFPKLVGRLGYRRFDREKIIAAITFQPEWLPQVAVKSLIWNKEIMDAIGGIFFKPPYPPNDPNKYGCADIPSSNGLTETMKTWGIVSSGKDEEDKKLLYALDMFCQFPYRSDSQESLWIDKIKIIKQCFAFPGLVFKSGEAIWLPFGLACAYDLCSNYGYRPIGEIDLIYREKKFQKYLYYYERDVQKMYNDGFSSIEVVGRRAYLYAAIYEDKVYNNILKNVSSMISIDSIVRDESHTDSIVEWRGLILTKIIENIFDKSDKKVEVWRRII
jgi:hypothetical protein